MKIVGARMFVICRFQRKYLKNHHTKKRKRTSRVLTKEIKKKLRKYMKQNEWKKQHYMQKQQMKMIDMHENLLDEGHIISYTTVRNFVNSEINKMKEVFIRRYCEPGYEVEFDWGEIKLKIDGKIRSYSLAVFTLAHRDRKSTRLNSSHVAISYA